MTDTVFFILLGAFIIGVAVLMLHWFRKWQRKPKEQQTEDVKKDFIQEIKGLILIPIAKFAWSGRNAPEGSLAKITWQVFIMVLIAFVFWLVLGLIDRRINGQDMQTPEDYFDQDFQ